MPTPLAVSLTTVTLRRLCRVGACPVLETAVTYPVLAGEETPAAVRFNETYRDLAESFLAWAETTPRSEAEAAFAALGAAAPYRFDRRTLTCDMTAAPWEQGAAEGERIPDRLRVTRTVRLSSRRGEAEERGRTETDLWRWPQLTLDKTVMG